MRYLMIGITVEFLQIHVNNKTLRIMFIFSLKVIHFDQRYFMFFICHLYVYTLRM